MIIDANVVLRILLNDNEEQIETALEIFQRNYIRIPNEVIAEVIYVLSGVYNIDKLQIVNQLRSFCSLHQIQVDKSILLSFDVFGQNRIDFVDSVLVAYKLLGEEVFTFDKKLNKLLSENS